MNQFRILRESIYVAVYWWLGGYALTWLLPAPWPERVAISSLAFGVFLYLISTFYEENGYQAPPWASCPMIALPMTMMFAGMVTWIMALIGLLS